MNFERWWNAYICKVLFFPLVGLLLCEAPFIFELRIQGLFERLIRKVGTLRKELVHYKRKILFKTLLVPDC